MRYQIFIDGFLRSDARACFAQSYDSGQRIEVRVTTTQEQRPYYEQPEPTTPEAKVVMVYAFSKEGLLKHICSWLDDAPLYPAVLLESGALVYRCDEIMPW